MVNGVCVSALDGVCDGPSVGGGSAQKEECPLSSDSALDGVDVCLKNLQCACVRSCTPSSVATF